MLLGILLLLFAKTQVWAQCVIPQVRHYAATQQVNEGLLTSVTLQSNAADGNPATFSKLNRLVGGFGLGDVVQFLKFDNPVTPGALISGGTPVTVKLTLPSGLLSIIGGVEIQPFKNLHDVPITGWQADAVGSATGAAALLSLLNGVGDQEITVTPSADFQGVWVKLSGVAVGQSLGLYDAYIMKTASASFGCNTPVDVLSGSKPTGALLGIGVAVGTVLDPTYAIDANLNSYAEMKPIVSVNSMTYHTTVFGSPSQKGDTIKMTLQNSGAGLLDLALAESFSIQLYNGASPVGMPITYTQAQLNLLLLPLGSNRYQLPISPSSSAVYDRVEVRVTALVGANLLIDGLRIYDVTRILAKPVVNSNATATTTTICYGTATTLAVSNTQDCTTYKWYNASNNNLLYTGASYALSTTLGVGTHTYYVVASRDGCTETVTSETSTVVVNPLPAITPGTGSGCVGATSATLNYTGGTNGPTTYSIVWDPSATNFVNVTDAALPSATAGAIAIAVPAGATAGTYTGNLTVKNANPCTSNNIPISVTVNALPAPPVLSITN